MWQQKTSKLRSFEDWSGRSEKTAQLDGLMSKLTEAVEMAQGMEERHNLAEEQHKSDTDSLQRRIDSLSEQAEKSQENVTSLRNELLAGMWLS